MTDTRLPKKPRAFKARRKSRRRRRLLILASISGILIMAATGAAWVSTKASEINSELASATDLIPSLQKKIAANDAGGAAALVDDIRNHTAAARRAADDPVWTMASTVPGLGSNFGAVAEVARSADDVASLGLAPLVKVYNSISWENLLPSSGSTNVESLQTASPSVSAAAHAVHLSADRLSRIDTGGLLTQVAAPLTSAREQLHELAAALNTAADAAITAPAMLGVDTPRSYLLMIQNNAELRASGGIPGALAILTLDKGKLTLGAQSHAGAIGPVTPTIPVDPEQQQIYSQRLGSYIQDVNLTPDFTTAAETAQNIWERKYNQHVDGVISIDPVALGYILDATGPVPLTDPELLAIASAGLPTELTGKNVVKALLSDVYERIEKPNLQDAYFAGVAQETFSALSDGRGSAKGIIEGLTRATSEGRILIWSDRPAEQSVIAKYAVSGSISGPSVAPAQFGVYFNDGTGGKMDFYVKRTVQIIQKCAANGYADVSLRITSTNTAPMDAATSLPAYVTAGGKFGVSPGHVQTNVTAYGPVQANLAGASQEDSAIPVSSHRHQGRPVGTTTVTLAPGETSTVDIEFNKIVQHVAPKLRVTPTVQSIEEVILDTQISMCPPA